jgi:hypothetical protein
MIGDAVIPANDLYPQVWKDQITLSKANLGHVKLAVGLIQVAELPSGKDRGLVRRISSDIGQGTQCCETLLSEMLAALDRSDFDTVRQIGCKVRELSDAVSKAVHGLVDYLNG